MGNGLVLTAAHVVGRGPAYTKQHVLIGGQDLSAQVLKVGSVEKIDWALLSVDQRRLLVSLQLRRNPVCKGPLQVGMNVVVVYPERTVHSQMISPLLIPPQYRSQHSTLINEPEPSGSGEFSAEQKCFIGTMSLKITKYVYQHEAVGLGLKPNEFAGYFVPISNGTFIPAQYKF